MASFCILLGYQYISRESLFTTDLFDLLPPSEVDSVVAELTERVSRGSERTVAFLFEGSKQNELSDAAMSLERTFREALIVTDPPTSTKSSFLAMIEKYTQNSRYLLSRKDSERLVTESGLKFFLDENRAALFSPFYSRLGGDVERDPLFLATRFMTDLSKSAPERDDAGRLVAHSSTRTLLISKLTLQGSPFSQDVQKTAEVAYSKARSYIQQQFPTVNLSRAGLVWIAAATATQMNSEVSALNFVALVGAFVLFWVVFRSVKALIITLIPLMVGAVTAFSLSLLVFPNLHAVTVGFGSVLVGGCTDYGVHYLTSHVAAGKNFCSPFTVLRKIFGGLTLGMLTSVAAFAAFVFTPLPALLQMALFASSGLLGAYLTVVVWYPYLTQRFMTGRSLQKSILSFLPTHGLRVTAVRSSLLLVTVILLVVGLFRLEVNDDVRLLTRVDVGLLQTERRIQELLNGPDPSRYILIEGRTPEETLSNESAVREQLSNLAMVGITDFVPSPALAIRSNAAVASICKNSISVLEKYAEELGLADNSREMLCDSRQVFEPVSILESLNQSGFSEAVKFLWLGETSRGFASVVRLKGTFDAEAVAYAANRVPGARYVDRIGYASHLISKYRVRATLVTALSYSAIFVFLTFRYGIRRTARLMMAPGLGALIALAILGLTGGSINVFSIFGILITLGLGIDFSLFIEEAKGHEDAATVGVITSALTSVLSFGLLGLSSMPMLNQFGISISAGILVAMLVASCTAKRRST